MNNRLGVGHDRHHSTPEQGNHSNNPGGITISNVLAAPPPWSRLAAINCVSRAQGGADFYNAIESQGRHVAIMNTVDEFRKLFPFVFNGEKIEITYWTGTPRHSKNLFQINIKNNDILLYVKESNRSPGFWGLTKHQIDRLNNSQVRWFAVLLFKKNDAGYVLSSKEVDCKIQDGSFELSSDGDYKVNERMDLNSSMVFRGIKNLLNYFCIDDAK